MPPLPSVEIPVIVRPDLIKSKASVRPAPKPRIYSDEPLPVIPSDYAPKNAKIIGRVIDLSGVHYTLKIGEVEINDVGVEEILEYVSAFELEQYENQQFVEEGIAQEAAEAFEEAQRQEKHERMKKRAKTKGVVFYETDTGSNDETEGGEEVVGRHGRARPTYTHLFRHFKEKKGKRIFPNMNGPLEMDNDVDDEDEEISDDEPVARAPMLREPASFTELPKRRRRRRDKVTGELLPLSPVARKSMDLIQLSPVAQNSMSQMKKRQRRRRHPLTGELMPVGWRFDPSDRDDTYEKRRDGQSLLYRKSSLSQEHEAKRPKLGTGNEWSRSPSPLPPKPTLSNHTSPTKPRPFTTGGRATIEIPTVDLISSEDELEERVPSKRGTANLKSPPKPTTPRSTNNMMRSMALSSAAETSPEPVSRPFIAGPSPSKTKETSPQELRKIVSPARLTEHKTSIMNPSASRASSTEPLLQSSEAEVSDDEEWFIEDVLAHSLSDPRTHPTSLGHEPVMLYKVKWEGFEDPTWEPAESFTVRSVLDDYRQRSGLPQLPSDDEMESEDDRDATVVPRDAPVSNNGDPEDDEDGLLSEDEYEIEGIVDHQLSDPRTHPPQLGQQPVMLYRVRWKGFEDLTWEPESSFEDTRLIRAYKTKHGLPTPGRLLSQPSSQRNPNSQSDSDEEMVG